jgi:hypothetical protein
MPLIAPQLRSERQVLSLKVDVRLLALLKHYTEFIDSAQDYVTCQALLVAFSKDPDFLAWLRAHYPADADHLRALLHERPSVPTATRATGADSRSTKA